MNEKVNANNVSSSDRRTVAAVASATVDGYLRNASRRHRVPMAEGGRGTRRKLAMVTSATVAEEVPSNKDMVDADDEWDEVDLPAVPVKKQENVKTDDTTAQPGGDAVKGEVLSVDLPIVKDEPCSASPSKTARASTKTETVIVDDDAAPADSGAAAGNAGEALPAGTRLPLMEQPQRTAWRRSDPAYEAMREQADLLAAQRRSDRMMRVHTAIFEFISFLERGRLLWREAHHPALRRTLLLLHRESDSAAGPPPKRSRTKKKSTGTSGESVQQREHLFSRAVTAARAIAKEAERPEHSKPSLAPAWVTATRDTVKNKTSEAILILVSKINEVFELEVPLATQDSNDSHMSPSENGGEVTGGGSPSGEEDAGEERRSQGMATIADWAAPLTPQFLFGALKAHRRLVDGQKVAVPHTVYFSLVFLALGAMAGLRCRLVMAKQVKKEKESSAAAGEGGNEEGEAGQPKPDKISIFYKDPKKNKKRDRAAGTEGQQVRSKKLCSSCFWVEVWSPERSNFIAVNPCAGSATLWGAPYTISISGDVAVDASPRYTSKFSSAYAFGGRLGRVSDFAFLWRDTLKWDDNREISAVLLETFSKDATAATRSRLPREEKQLESLTYAEPIPVTLTALQRHPLFVIESSLARHEGIYPKDASTTVGRVKGHDVYKRSAVVNLRSRDGWLREGRSLICDDDAPYKEVPPPASRPFATPSRFYGMWQTKPFEPLPLRPDQSIPHHGKTSWYILLGAQPPAGLVHLTEPHIARVARRMQLDFGHAVMGFNKRQVDERRRGHWESVIDGIVVRQVDEKRLRHAYEEWRQLTQEQEAAKRRDRALHWWLLLIQRSLAMDRLRSQYLDGASCGPLA